MEILIHREGNSDVIKQSEIKWKLITQKNIVYYNIYGVLGITILLFVGFLLPEDESFWGLGSSLGLSFVFLSLFCFSHHYQNKSNYLKRVKQSVGDYNKQNEVVEIRVTDKSVSYKDFQMNYNMEWSVFKQYALHDNHLFIITDPAIMSSVTIGRDEISVEDFEQLLEFVKTKLVERK